jgi:hypothetical protein
LEIEVSDLLVQSCDPSGETPEREFGCLERFFQAGPVVPETAAKSRPATQRLSFGQHFSEVCRRRDHEVPQLDKGRSPSLQRPISGDLELVNRFDQTGYGLRHDLRIARKDLACSRLGIDGVRLASPMAGVGVRAVDLHNRDADTDQDAAELGSV